MEIRSKRLCENTFENYYKNHDPYYNYNWEELFNKLGFTKK